jgi:hypothetical protein
MSNTRNDIQKFSEAWGRHLEAISNRDCRWQELSAEEIVKLLSVQTLGLNGGNLSKMSEAAEIVGFDDDNIVFVAPNVAHVLALIEFTDEGRVH